MEAEAAPEYPIELDFFPAARSRELNNVVELIKSLPLLVRMDAGDRAALTIAAKTAQFLHGLLGRSIVVDDEGRLSLADDQGSVDRVPLGLHGRLLVNASIASCESALQLLRQRLAADLFVVDGKPLPVDDDLRHETSPSVGAPKGAVRDNSKPTEGEQFPGAAATPNAVVPGRNKTDPVAS